MATLGVISTVTVFFKEVPMKFKIEAIIADELSKERQLVGGIDAIEFRKALDKLTRNMEYQGIGKSLKEENINFYGMESIARYILKKMKKDFPIKQVKVWEGQDEYVTVSLTDIENS